MVAALARAGRLSDLAVPPPELIASGWLPWILNFYWRAVGLFRQFPGSAVTSWYRTPERNRIEGGSTESQHLFALAWDVVVPEPVRSAFEQAAERAALVAVREKRHVHLQLFPKGALARAGVRFPR